MIIRVREWFGALSLREKRMIMAMAAIALPVLAWMLFIRPVSAAYDDALKRHLEAVDRNGRVRALADIAKAGPAAASTAAPVADVSVAVTESAGQAGLAIADNSPQGADAVSISIEQAPAAVAMRWLGDLEARGLAVEEWRLSPAGEGSVSVTARIRKAN